MSVDSNAVVLLKRCKSFCSIKYFYYLCAENKSKQQAVRHFQDFILLVAVW